jgi:hypothetical protein
MAITVTPEQHNSKTYQIKDAIRDIEPGGTVYLTAGTYYINHFSDMDDISIGDGWPGDGVKSPIVIQKPMQLVANGAAVIQFDSGSENTPFERCCVVVKDAGGNVFVGGGGSGFSIEFRARGSGRVRAAALLRNVPPVILQRIYFMPSIGEQFSDFDGTNNNAQIFAADITQLEILESQIPMVYHTKGVFADQTVSKVYLVSNSLSRWRPATAAVQNDMRDVHAPDANYIEFIGNTFNSQGHISEVISLMKIRGAGASGMVSYNTIYGPGSTPLPPPVDPKKLVGGLITCGEDSHDININGNVLYYPETTRFKGAIALYSDPYNITIQNNTIYAAESQKGYGIIVGLTLGGAVSCSENKFNNLWCAYVAECCPHDSNQVTIQAATEQYNNLRWREAIRDSRTGGTGEIKGGYSDCYWGGWGCLSLVRLKFV